MPVLSHLCRYFETDNVQTCESKTFNNMSPTEGFEYPYPQYMCAVFLLRTCYDLLQEAGFKHVTKDEDEQSLTIWGLKLFFVSIAGHPNTVNIVGPGIDFLYKRNKQYASNENEAPSSSLGELSTRHNHFLQHSLIDSGNIYRKEGAKYASDSSLDVSGLECANGFYQNTDDNGVTERMLYVTLRCSNDGICFSTQIYNERQDLKGYQYPLFSIFKGKDLLNNKDILVLGKKIERVPFVFSTPFYNTRKALSSQDSLTLTTTETSNGWYTAFTDYSPNWNLFNGQIEFYSNRKTKVSQKKNHAYITASLDSALVCSGNNLIYYADDTYNQLEDTLYLDWKYSITDNIIVKGNAIANSGKYEVYGLNEVLLGIPVQSNYYYTIDGEKYWCMFNHLITRYSSFKDETDINVLKSNMDTNYFNEIYSHTTFAQNIAYRYNSAGNNGSTNGISLTPTLDYLNSYANSFGKMKKNYYEDIEGTMNAKKRAVPVALNPAFLMRIDDTITE